MLLLITVIPLISALIVSFSTRILTKKGGGFLCTIFLFSNVIILCYLFVENTICNSFAKLFSWIVSDLFQINWIFYIDGLTIIMLLVVNIVSTIVHLYSTDYMEYDPHLTRFMSYLSIFTFFMLILVTGDNFVILFLGWEGVGLCSYLLISFWYTRIQATKSAIKALVVNRVADWSLTIGMVFIYFFFQSLDFHVIFLLAQFFQDTVVIISGIKISVLSLICSLLFIGAMGKSAQIGLHTWLPDAMEGPTPVSALIHAATMVTAGVFLVIKSSFIFEYAPAVLSIVIFVGALTAFFSATIGLLQNDIKKVIAYSTCSQLGYMLFACGTSNYSVSIFHLANHAFFKALLFLSAGAIIHSLSNEQDMRRFGALIKLLPFTSIMLIIGSLALMGFPFLTGYYSKDLILELAFTKYTIEGTFAYTIGLITALFTSYYSLRVFLFTFSNGFSGGFKIRTNGFWRMITNIHELPHKMASALLLLSIGSIILGYFTKELVVGLSTNFWNQSILCLSKNNNILDAEFFGLHDLNIPNILNNTSPYFFIKLLPFFLSLLAILFVFFIKNSVTFWNKSLKITMLVNKIVLEIYSFLTYKWAFDPIYNRGINQPLLHFSKKTIFKNIDQEVLEWVGPTGLSKIIFNGASHLKKLHVGEVYYYGYFMLMFLLIFSQFLKTV